MNAWRSLQSTLLELCGMTTMLLLATAYVAMAHAESPQSDANPEEKALPLPQWSQQELRAFRDSLPALNGPGVLLPEFIGTTGDLNEILRTPLSIGPRLDHLFTDQKSELSPRLRSEDMRLFLPESLLGQPAQRSPQMVNTPTPLSSLRDMTPEFLAACTQALPSEYLIDPDVLVPEMEHSDIERFLEFHARDAHIKLYVLITAHDRKLPEAAELNKIASGSLLRASACLLVYPLGEPWRARLFVSKSVHEQTSPMFLSETVQACTREAMQSSDGHDQLHRYAVNLSTRLFWLQKALGLDAKYQSGNEQTLAEVAPEAAVISSTLNREGILLSMAWVFSSVFALGIAGVFCRRFQRQRQLKMKQSVWILPEPETIPRLGGAFTGGGGGMTRYS